MCQDCYDCYDSGGLTKAFSIAPLSFPDGPTILFQLALHEYDDEVQTACLESLLLLTKEGKSGYLAYELIE